MTPFCIRHGIVSGAIRESPLQKIPAGIVAVSARVIFMGLPKLFASEDCSVLSYIKTCFFSKVMLQ